MLRKYEHISGPARTALRDDVVARYRRGEPIREIAADLGRSYGFVHKLILESGVEFRSRGARRRRNRETGVVAAAVAVSAAAEVPGQMEMEMALTGVVTPLAAATETAEEEAEAVPDVLVDLADEAALMALPGLDAPPF